MVARRASGPLIALVVATSTSAARADDLEVIVRGDATNAFRSTTSTDTSPRDPLDPASLLAELPSVHVRRLGGEGSIATLSIRGSASTGVGATLAGVPLTSAADPSVDVASLPLWPGATYRVYRGFAPATIGAAGYLGGVLAIDAPTTTTGAKTSWWAAGGSFGSAKLRLGDARRVGSIEIAGGLFASRTDGDFAYDVEDPATGRLVEKTRSNAKSASLGVIERVAMERSWGTIGALVFADGRRSGIPGSVQAPTELTSLAASRVLASADASLRIGESSSFRVVGWGRRETSAVDDPRGELDVLGHGTSSNRVIAGGGSATYRASLRDDLRATLILDGRAEDFRADDAARDTSLPASRVAGGLGGELDWRPIARVTILGSARADARHDRATSGDSGEAWPSGHVGASFAIAPELVVSAHAGALARPPSFLELYGNGGALLGDPTLRSERATSIDLGARGVAGDARTSLAYEVVGFVSFAHDLLSFVPYGRNTFRAVNTSRATLGGLEVSTTLVASKLRTQLSYTLLATRGWDDASAPQGSPLPGRPMHDLAYDASYRFGPIEVRYALDAIAGTTLGGLGDVVLPPRFLHGVGGAIEAPFARGLVVGASLDNLFDARTGRVDSPALGHTIAWPLSDFSGFPLPGRTLWITARWSRP